MAGRGSCSSNRGGGNSRGGRSPRLPELNERHDRYCPYCGHVICDMALERMEVCPNARCLRPLPLNPYRRRPDGFSRCPRCYCIGHRSFVYCEMCGRAKQPTDGNKSVNLEGVDLDLVGPDQIPRDRKRDPRNEDPEGDGDAAQMAA